MEPTREQIAPEIIQAIIAQATANGLTVNGYLARLLGLTNGVHKDELALSDSSEQVSSPRNERMLAALQQSAERLKDVSISGSTDETLKIIREGRAGALWGYEPTDTE